MALDANQHQTADETELRDGASRRAVLRTVAAGSAALAVGLTADACSSQSSAGPQAPTTGAPVAQTSQVPVGGGDIVPADGGIVITQPNAGTYKAFSAICTHGGCTVGTVQNNQIICPCHGSVYSAQDGSVLQGPAPAPLAAKPITVSGTNIFVA